MTKLPTNLLLFSACFAWLACFAMTYQVLAEETPAAPTADSQPQRQIQIQIEPDALSAYQAGLKAGKPIALIFVCPTSDESCRYCKDFRKSVESAEVAALADKVVFGYCVVDRREGAAVIDQAAATLFERLEIETTPTISLIKPDATVIHELGRIKGYFKADDLAFYLRRFAGKYEPGKTE